MLAKMDRAAVIKADKTGFLQQLNALLDSKESMDRRAAIITARKHIFNQRYRGGMSREAIQYAEAVGVEFVYAGDKPTSETIRTSVGKDRVKTLAKGNIIPERDEIATMAMDFGLLREKRDAFISAGTDYITNRTEAAAVALPETTKQAAPATASGQYSSELHRILQEIFQSCTCIIAPATIFRPSDPVPKHAKPAKLNMNKLKDFFGILSDTMSARLLQGKRPSLEGTFAKPMQHQPSHAETEYKALGALLTLLKATDEEKKSAYAAHKQWLIDNEASDEIMPAAYKNGTVASNISQAVGWSSAEQAGAVSPDGVKKSPARITR